MSGYWRDQTIRILIIGPHTSIFVKYKANNILHDPMLLKVKQQRRKMIKTGNSSKEYLCCSKTPTVTRKPSCLHYIMRVKDIELSARGYKSSVTSVFERHLSFFSRQKNLLSVFNQKGRKIGLTLIKSVPKSISHCIVTWAYWKFSWK